METLRTRFGASQRRACRVVGQHRSTQSLAPPTPDEDEAWLREWLRAFSRQRPRWGWRRAAKQLRREGHPVNGKRVRRLWRDEALKVPYRKRKRPHRGIGAAAGAFRPVAPNVLWAMDFQSDLTAEGRMLKVPNVVDPPPSSSTDPTTPAKSSTRRNPGARPEPEHESCSALS